MQFFLLSLVVLATLTDAIDEVFLWEELGGATAYGYHQKIGIPEAERIKKEEEELISLRIPGGVPAGLGQYPFKVGIISDLIGLDNVSACGGALVSTSRVVTAAHCWYDGHRQAWRVTVVLGSTLLFSGGIRVTSNAVAIHPYWWPSLLRNDIAVIYLASPVATSNIIAPIALPTGSELFEDFVGEAAIVIGYGSTRDGDSLSINQNLNHAKLLIVANSVCFVTYPVHIQISNICTSGLGSVGICDGDSGGPLVVTRNNRLILVGISSFRATAGCQTSMPSVFTRVTAFMDFIIQNM